MVMGINLGDVVRLKKQHPAVMTGGRLSGLVPISVSFVWAVNVAFYWSGLSLSVE